MNKEIFALVRKATALAVLCAAATCAAQTKRPLTHLDYDAWRSIGSQVLSRDGKFLAYGLFPQDGDGEVVVRNLSSGTEWRQPAGEQPAAGGADPNAEDAPAARRGVSIEFSPDGRTVIFSTFPAKADVAKAKKEKRKPEDMPKGGMVIRDLTSGTAVRIADVKNFQVPMTGKNVLAYLREAPKERASDKDADRTAKPSAASPEASEQKPATATPAQPASDAKGAAGKKKDYGAELVLRNLADGSERAFVDVLDYKLSKDGATLVYAVSSKKEENNGVYVASTSDAAAPRALLTGRGKYLKMAWDEPQSQVAFVSDHDDAAAKQLKFKLYRWERQAPQAVELVSAATSGFREGCEPSDKAAISFSRDGKRIFFGCAAAKSPEKEADAGPTDDEKVSVDLWHWKDDYIQPMQKVRANADKDRTYRCVYHVVEKKMVQIADRTMSDAAPSEDGLWAMGGDDREYRSMADYDGRYMDAYLVNTRTGERKLLAKKQRARPEWSPDGKYAIYFEGKDWSAVSVPEGKSVNLTAKLGVNFFHEDDDKPEVPPAYGMASWTSDGKYVLVYDEFDIWKIAPQTNTAVNLTHGLGRKEHLQFRYVRLNPDPRDPDAKWIDPAQPVLLQALQKDTFDGGFYRVALDSNQPPQKLMMASKAFSAPIKAKDANVFLLTENTSREFPDLQITDSSFVKLQKVSNANPQISDFLWNTAEAIHFRNTDGVNLSGVLYKPENFDPSKKYPMLVLIYEKLGDKLYNFDVPKPSHVIVPSFYASNGYLVLLPDIVYTVGQPGQSALKCVLPAIQSVVDRGFVDEKAIGIQSHSWGGYQIAYMITQTNRFRAVAAGALVSNMTSAYDGIRWGTGIPRQFQYEHGQSRIGGNLWESPLHFIENSPLFMADQVHTPLLMLHNDADDAVPWYQGIEFYLALRRLGREVYMFTYNGEPHGLQRRANQKDYTVRMQQFFDHYLKGGPEPEWMAKGIPYLERDQEKEKLKKATGVY